MTASTLYQNVLRIYLFLQSFVWIVKFRSHIQEICINTSKKIGVLSRLEDMISTETKLHLYKYAILLNLTYCNTVRHFCAKSDRRKLETTHKSVLFALYLGENNRD